MDLRQLAALVRRRRPRQLLGRRPGPAHRAVERLHPRRPARARARASPSSTGPTGRLTEEGEAGRGPGPPHPGRARRRSSPTSPRSATRCPARVRLGRDRHHRPLARAPRCSTAMADAPPRRSSVVVRRRHHHLARSPSSLAGAPRPGRGQPAGRRPRRRRPSRCSTRTASLVAPERPPARPTRPRSTLAELADHDAAARAAGHRLPRRPRRATPPRAGVHAAGRRPRSTACASSPRWPSRASAPPSCPPPPCRAVARRPTWRRVAGRRPRAPLGRAWPGAGGACSSAPAAAPCATCCAGVVAARQPSADRGDRRSAAVHRRYDRDAATDGEPRSERGRERHDHRQPHGRVDRDPDRQRRRRRHRVAEAPAGNVWFYDPAFTHDRGHRAAPSPSSTATPASSATAATRSSSWPSSRPTSRSPTSSSTASCPTEEQFDDVDARRSRTTRSSTRTCASGSWRASTTTPTRWGCSCRPSPRCRPSTPRPRTSTTRRSATSRSSGSSPRCRRWPPCAYRFSVGHAVRLPGQLARLHRQLPVDDVEDRRAPLRAPTRCWPGPSTCCSSSTPTTSRTAAPTAMRVVGSVPRRPLLGHRGGRRRPLRPPPRRRQRGRSSSMLDRDRLASTTSTPSSTTVKEGKGRLQGFGHRVYKNYDPRAKIIKQTADEVFEVTGKNPLLDIALKLEEVALADEYFISRKLYPNVDFYSGLIYQAMGFPIEMFTGAVRHPPHRRAGWPTGRSCSSRTRRSPGPASSTSAPRCATTCPSSSAERLPAPSEQPAAWAPPGPRSGAPGLPGAWRPGTRTRSRRAPRRRSPVGRRIGARGDRHRRRRRLLLIIPWLLVLGRSRARPAVRGRGRHHRLRGPLRRRPRGHAGQAHLRHPGRRARRSTEARCRRACRRSARGRLVVGGAAVGGARRILRSPIAVVRRLAVWCSPSPLRRGIARPPRRHLRRSVGDAPVRMAHRALERDHDLRAQDRPVAPRCTRSGRPPRSTSRRRARAAALDDAPVLVLGWSPCAATSSFRLELLDRLLGHGGLCGWSLFVADETWRISRYGATAGHRRAGLVVVDVDTGEAPTPRESLVRAIAPRPPALRPAGAAGGARAAG